MKTPESVRVTRERTLEALRDAITAVESDEDCGIVLILCSVDRPLPGPMPHVYSSSGAPKAGYVLKALAVRCAILAKTIERDAILHGYKEDR